MILKEVQRIMLSEKAKSRAQQRFFGMVRAAQKGEGAASPEVAKVAGEISKKDAKDFAKTKHKGLPEKKKVEEELTGDLKTDAERYRVPRGPGGNPKRLGDKVRSMNDNQPLGKLKVKYGADKVREYYKKNKAVGESAVLDANKKLEGQAWRKKKQKEYAKLIAIYNHQKQLEKQGLGSPTKRKKTTESFEIDKSAHKKAQRQSKIRNLAKDNKNPNEKAAAEGKLKGPKLAWEEFKKHI